jgi:hypothetical protein
MSNEINKLRVPTVKEMIANNERPDILFWVGCAGSFDDRAKKNFKSHRKNSKLL